MLTHRFKRTLRYILLALHRLAVGPLVALAAPVVVASGTALRPLAQRRRVAPSPSHARRQRARISSLGTDVSTCSVRLGQQLEHFRVYLALALARTGTAAPHRRRRERTLRYCIPGLLVSYLEGLLRQTLLFELLVLNVAQHVAGARRR